MALESKTKNKNTQTHNKMDKLRLRVALKVLSVAKDQFSDTKQFIEDSIDQERLKENISADEAIFFTSLEAKSQLRKTFFGL